MSESLPAALSARTLQLLLDRIPLTEAISEDLTSPMSPAPVGSLRVWRGDGVIERLVAVSLVVPPINLDSHMLFAFSRASSAVPHFTLDSVYGGEYHAYHLDLIPRAELSSHLSYMDAAYHPLTKLYEEWSQREGLSRAHISPRQHALMSPWMLVHRATEDAFRGLTPVVEAYLSHWLSTFDEMPDISDTDLAARDRAVRENLFSPGVDPVWGQVARLLGAEATERMRGLLIGGPLT